MIEADKLSTEDIIKKIKDCEFFIGFRNISVFCKLAKGLASVKNCISCITILGGSTLRSVLYTCGYKWTMFRNDLMQYIPIWNYFSGDFSNPIKVFTKSLKKLGVGDNYI